MSLNFAGPDRLLARYQRSGDPRALGKLFDRTAPELLRVAAWLCGNRADAEDVLQRTFVTVIETRGAFDATKRALPWLCGIVGNHAKKLHEQRQRRVAPTGERAGERDPAHAAADAELAATVAQLRSELGSPYAEVLDLHLGEGLNAKEIAARLGRPAGTVRTQLVRALDLLRRQLPAGFAAGLALSASASASSFATVRAAVVPGGAVAVTSFTFGGLLMGKKVAVVVPALVLLLGSGAWALVDSDGAAPVRAEAPPLEVAGVARRTQAERPDEPPARAAQRGAVADANDLAPDADTATLVVRASWQHDGSPAARIGISVTPQRPRLQLFERDGLTGADGSFVMRGIRPAVYSVDSPYSDERSCEVAAGSVTTLDLSVQRAAVVRGIVVDADDRPVPDARVWLTDHDSWERSFEMARSDANGRFELPLRGSQYIGARKAGYAPSRLRALQSVPEVDVTLRLPSLGGMVRGRVFGAGGEPLAGALVQVGVNEGMVAVAGSTRKERYLEPKPELLRTDALGTFVADGVAGGKTNVRAWAADHGAVAQQVLVDAGRTIEVTLTLPRGAAVQGTVRDEQQRPVANAFVSPGNGFGSVTTTTDANGFFRLDHLFPGTREIQAARDRMAACATLQLQPGQVATWNPVLVAPPRVGGTLVDPDGRPIEGFDVGTFQHGEKMQSARTDAVGRFEFGGSEGQIVDFVVSRRGMGVSERKGVRVEAGFRIRLTDAEMPSASIQGRVVDDAGKVVAFASIEVMNAQSSFATRIDSRADGTFVSEALSPGTYWLTVDARDFGAVQLPPFAIAPRERRALDDIVLSRPGRVELVLRGAEVPPGGLVLFCRDDGTGRYAKSPDGRRVEGELTVGGYTAMTQVGDLAGAASFTVHAGKTTHVELVLAPCVPIAAEFHVVPPPKPGETLRTIARDAAGNVVAAGILDFRVQQPDGPPRLCFRVPPGPCVLETRHSTGRTVTTAFTAGPPGAKEQRVVVALQAK